MNFVGSAKAGSSGNTVVCVSRDTTWEHSSVPSNAQRLLPRVTAAEALVDQTHAAGLERARTRSPPSSSPNSDSSRYLRMQCVGVACMRRCAHPLATTMRATQGRATCQIQGKVGAPDLALALSAQHIQPHPRHLQGQQANLRWLSSVSCVPHASYTAECSPALPCLSYGAEYDTFDRPLTE